MFNFHFIIQQCHPIFLNSYCVRIYCTLSGSLNNFASSYFSHMVASLFFVKDVTNFWMEIFALLLACNMTHTYKLENKTCVFMLTKLLNKIWYCLPQKLIQKYAYGKRFNCLRNITNFSLYSIINCPFVVLLYITAIIIIFYGEIISSTWNFVEIYISIKICIFIIW